MTVTESTETERKYEAANTARTPVFSKIPGIDHAADPDENYLEAVYFDTSDLTLAARGITLRRRTGGRDDGWHLKLVLDADSRQETHAPLGRPDKVPADLNDRLQAYTRGKKLKPLALISTRRATYRLYGPSGEHLADFTDDHATTTNLRTSHTGPHWREWEIELVHATPKLFTAAEDVLSAAGAQPAGHHSKIARAMGADWPSHKKPAAREPRKKGPVLDIALAYLDAQINALITHDAGVRHEDPDAVHHMRSAARRARSALTIYAPLFKKKSTATLRRELRWIGRMLGRPRDAEVMRKRLLTSLATLPEVRAAGPAQTLIEHQLATAYDNGYQRAVGALQSKRYFNLLTALEDFRDNPPTKPLSGKKARKNSALLVNKAAARLERSQRKAKKLRNKTGYDTALHTVRKDAKILRHAAESVSTLHSKRAHKLEKAGHRIQEILGEHQDAVLALELLESLDGAGTAAISEVLKELVRAQTITAERAKAAYEKAWKENRGLRLRR